MSKGVEGKSIYSELGFKDAGEMLVKAKLVVKIAEILRERGWSQQEAAKVLGLTQPKLSKMLRGQFRGISEIKMMDCLVRLRRESLVSNGARLGSCFPRSQNRDLGHPATRPDNTNTCKRRDDVDASRILPLGAFCDRVLDRFGRGNTHNVLDICDV